MRYLFLLFLFAPQTLFAVDVGEVHFPDATNLEPYWLQATFGIMPNDPFSTTAVEQGLDRLYATGFFAERPTAQTEANEGKAIISIRFREWPVLESIVLDGATWVDPQTLLDALTLQEGEMMNTKEIVASWAIIRDLYSDAGYPWIYPAGESLDPKTRTLTLSVGQPVLGTIRFEGLNRTDASALKRFLWMEQGDALELDAILLDARDLFRTGIFLTFPEPRPQPPSNPDEDRSVWDLVYHVQENSQTGRFLFGVGFGDLSGFSGTVSYEESNFQGQVKTVGASVGLGESGFSYDLSYANRSIGPSHISFGARGFKSTSLVRIYPDGGGENSDFEGDSSGGSIDFGRPLDRKNRIDLRLSSTDNRFTHESGPVLTPTDLIDNAIQDGRANSARLSFTHDTRFDPFSPREGRYERFATEWGGGMLGGEFSYGKQTIDFRTYHPMGEKWVFASRYTGGIIGGSAPATTLFWVGGANSLRGYEVGEQKGKFMALSNVEFRYSPPDSPYGLVAFVDMGTTSNEWKSLSFKNPLIGAGIGFRMQVGFFGVAPIRFDLGYNFEDGNTQFHFSVGHLF